MLRPFLLLTPAISLALASLAGAAQLRVDPEKLELTGRESMHGVVVTLMADNGELTDVTRRAHFETAAAQIAAVDPKGMVRALADGQTELTVQADGLTTKVPVQVSAFANRPAPSFKQEVLPIL